jgi:hypothetical protein
MDNYYAESPVWMVDLGRRTEVTGVIITTWQGDGQGTGYKVEVYVDVLIFCIGICTSFA